MLVDVVVRKGEIIAAKPASDIAPPIVLVTLVDGVVIPAIKWASYSTSGLNDGRLKGKAIDKAIKVVMDNGTLNISGEYGSIEINKREFKADLELQK